MQDAKGRDLKVGDTVVLPCKVVDVKISGATDVFGANVVLETLGGRAPTGARTYHAVNERQVVRANEGDDTKVKVVEDNGKQFLR